MALPRLRTVLTLFSALLAALLLKASCWAADPPTIAAAADLKFALPEIAGRFAQETGRTVKLTFGSSGNFTRQIEQGAPFELFLSADEEYILRLAEKGLAQDRGVLYAIGQLALFAPHGSPIPVAEGLEGLRRALAEGKIKRFAIANPEHAPYGRAAREALVQAGVWPLVESRLVYGENAAQAMQFAASGSSQGGIVPLSLSKAREVAQLGSFVVIPVAVHADEPLRQRMALLRAAGETAREFYAYLQRPAVREIFIRNGFVLPGEGSM